MFIIRKSKVESVAAGNYTDAIFRGIEEFKSAKGDDLFRWKFEVGGVQASAVTGNSDPTIKNRLGKFLCALAAKPLAEGTSVEPSEYIGKKYFVVIVQKENGSQVEMFSLLA